MTANVTITRLNHLVCCGSATRGSRSRSTRGLNFRPISEPTDRGVFLRASGSDNHHDLALFSIGADAPGPTTGKQVGMYHAAFEVATIEDLVRAREALIEANALVGETDHGASLSLYVKDPDGNELEIFLAAAARRVGDTLFGQPAGPSRGRGCASDGRASLMMARTCRKRRHGPGEPPDPSVRPRPPIPCDGPTSWAWQLPSVSASPPT